MKNKRRLSIVLATAAPLLIGLFTGAWSCQGRGGPFDRQQAAKRVLSRVERIWEKADQRKGLRVNQLDRLLPAGSTVRPAVAGPGREVPEVVCRNECWLFFVDEEPLAHFAHPAHFIVLDAKTGAVEVVASQWWPEVDGEPVFSKLEERTAAENVIFERIPQLERQVGEQGPNLVAGEMLRLHDPCDAWAIIVCGYDDLPDTFDEDTDGIYTVLTGLGLPDDHIFFVSPHTTHPGVDRPTTIANVQWAINQVAAQSDETDKVLFFYSSHGGIDSLSCVPWDPGGGSIAASDLDNWLDGIDAQELTVIVEACHSGSLIGLYADGTYVAAEDDLTGDGETNRAIFTSASTDTSSYPDVDWAGDPNPGDSGSETIWGYVEAFGTASADGDGDGEISFGEAWQYAWNNDVTRIDGVNTPQMVDTGLVADNVYNYCYRITGDADLFIADGPADVGNNSFDYDSTDIWVTLDPADTDHQDVVSGATNYVHVAVHNRGTTDIANGTLKVYWADTSTATSWPGDFTQIGSTHSFGPLASGGVHTYTWTWDVDPAIGLGHHFCLVALADSPDDPMTGGPPGITYPAPFDNNIGQKNVTIVEDHGTGHGSFQFVLANNTESAETMDLIVEWVGRPWGSVVLELPDDLMAQVERGTIKLDGLRRIQGTEEPGGLELSATKATGGVRNIALEPGASRIVEVRMATRNTTAGQRSEIRLRQERQGQILGALKVRLQEVHPADCGWVLRSSVEAFQDLAVRHELVEADRVRQLFAARLDGSVCCDKGSLATLLTEAQRLEKAVLEALVQRSEPGTLEQYGAALDELTASLAAGKLTDALRAQGAVSVAARDL